MTASIATANDFDTQVLQAQLPALVYFHAPWCVYCRRLGPAFDKVADRLAGQLLTAKVDIDDVPELAQRYGVRTIPTLMVFKGGEAAGTVVGPGSIAEIEEFVSQTLNNQTPNQG